MTFPNMSMVFVSAGVMLSASQGPIKPVRTPGDSKSSVKNNEGVDLLLKGNLKGSLKLFDEASLLDFGDPTPWVNGSLANLIWGRLSLAGRSLAQARLLGDRSDRLNTLSIEIDTARGHLTKAWGDVLSSEFQAPEDPYLHVARAKFADSAGFVRMAERSRWQAYRRGFMPLVDSKPFNAAAFGFGGGAVSNLHLSADSRKVSASSAIVGGLAFSTEELGSTAHARQSLLRADVSNATRLGTFMGSYRWLEGDRPGSLSASSIFSTTPGARLRYDSLMAGWQKSWSQWTAHVSLREARVDLRSAPSSTTFRNSFQNQAMVEGRYDSGPWTAGAGMSEVYRSSVANPAMEPFEEVFGQGRTRLAHSYVVHRARLGPSIRLLSGAILNSVEDNNTGLLASELSVRLFGDRFLRIGAKPSMNRVGTNLYPEDLRARSRILRVRPQNRPLFSPAGRQTDFYAQFPIVSTAPMEAQVRIFRTEMTNALFASGDPELISAMELTEMRKARIMGTTVSASWTPSTRLEVHASASVQNSEGRYALSQHDGRVPNVPSLRGSLEVAAAMNDWSLSMSSNYLGPRTQAATKLDLGGVPGVVTRDAPGVWTLDVSASRPWGDGFLTFSADNITRSVLYPGFGISSSYRLSYQQRY